MPVFENTGLFLGSSSLGLTWFTMDASESMDMLFSLGLEDLDSFLFGASTRLNSFTLSLLGRVDSGVFSSEADLAFSYTLPLFHMGQSLDFNDTLGLIWNGKMSLHNYFEVLYSDKRHSEMGSYHLFFRPNMARLWTGPFLPPSMFRQIFQSLVLASFPIY